MDNVEPAREERIHMTRMMSPSAMKAAAEAEKRRRAMETPQRPRSPENDSPIHLSVSSPELDMSDRRDRAMEAYSRSIMDETPASRSVHKALSDISMIDVSTPDSPAPGVTPIRRAPRKHLPFGGVTLGGGTKGGHRAPEVYEDTGTPESIKRPGKESGESPLVSRPFNIVREALFFHLEMSNAESKGRNTRTIRTSLPTVDDSSLLHGGLCKITFKPDLNVADPPPLGVISIQRDLLPSAPATREERSGLLLVDPIYVVPPSRQVTLVLPSTNPDTIVNHFVVDLLHRSGVPLVRLAISKRVMVSLLHLRTKVIKFYNIPVAEGIAVSLVMHVERIRSGKRGRMLVSVEQVDWYVPEDIGRLIHADMSAEPMPQTPMDSGAHEVVDDEGWSDIESYMRSAIALGPK